MFACFFGFGQAAFVFGADVFYVVGESEQLILSVVGLADYAFVGFCDVMLDADDVFETPWFAYVRCQFDGLVVDAI